MERELSHFKRAAGVREVGTKLVFGEKKLGSLLFLMAKLEYACLKRM